jgi:hypothetical protein
VTRTDIPLDAPGRAPQELVTEIGAVVRVLESACARALELQAQRAEGRDWYDIVSSEDRPLIVEQISSAMSGLATAGGRWRRTQARALQGELYGVTRQRVSALLRGREDAEPGPGA